MMLARASEGSGAPALGDDGLLYVPCGRAGDAAGGSQVLALRKESGETVWSVTLDGETVTSAAALAPGGMLYVGTASGTLYAVATDSEGLDPEACWPAFRHDARNTGRAENAAANHGRECPSLPECTPGPPPTPCHACTPTPRWSCPPCRRPSADSLNHRPQSPHAPPTPTPAHTSRPG